MTRKQCSTYVNEGKYLCFADNYRIDIIYAENYKIFLFISSQTAEFIEAINNDTAPP